ncbi:diguanylate cyclase [Vibrio lentus]|nr:diguanylate cyclase [Vibrio lentus]
MLLIAFFSLSISNFNCFRIDVLTGLLNRSYLESANSRIRHNRTSKNNRCIGVIAIDSDHFQTDQRQLRLASATNVASSQEILLEK